MSKEADTHPSPIGDAEGRLRDYAMQLQYPNDAAGAARIVYGPDRSVDGRRVLESGHEAAHALYLDISALLARLETAERENKGLDDALTKQTECAQEWADRCATLTRERGEAVAKAHAKLSGEVGG